VYDPLDVSGDVSGVEYASGSELDQYAYIFERYSLGELNEVNLT
jgi:hypothetical protein